MADLAPDPAVAAFWRDFSDTAGVKGPYEAWAFGGEDTPELATELALLVRDGPKRATTGRLDEFEQTERRCPRSGATA